MRCNAFIHDIAFLFHNLYQILQCCGTLDEEGFVVLVNKYSDVNKMNEVDDSENEITKLERLIEEECIKPKSKEDNKDEVRCVHYLNSRKSAKAW